MYNYNMCNEKLSLELYNITIDQERLSKVNDHTFEGYINSFNASVYLSQEVTNVILSLSDTFKFDEFDLKASIFANKQKANELEKQMIKVNGRKANLIYVSMCYVYDVETISFYVYIPENEDEKTLIHMIILKNEKN